jgi:tetratricopeptide (TPR) repeat protein
MLAVGGLFLVAALSFSAVFFYQYMKPKYGGLVLKTTPPGAMIFVDGRHEGVSPLTIADLRAGGHQIRAVMEGYKDLLQQVEVMPYATENMHWNLDPLVAHLTNEQLAEVEAWRKKLDSAQGENILFPPPDDYNVLFFIKKILAIDPANAYALQVKANMAEGIRKMADAAYAREDWLEAEKQYKNLALLYPEDIPTNERLADIAAKIDASTKDREAQVADWQAKAEAATKAGSLVPPEKDNALDALRNILRLDKKNAYARDALNRVREMLQNRGDTKLAGNDFQGARNDFRLALQYFPDDTYSKSRLAIAEARASETAQAEQQRMQRMQEELQSRQRVAALRQSATNSFRSGAFERAISEWQEYLKVEPNSDEAYYYIGASYQEEKQFDTAILNFEKCLSLNPNNASAHANLGILYDRHRNDTARAAEHLKKARELGGMDKYPPDRLQLMIQDLQDRAQLEQWEKTPFGVEHKHAFSSCRGTLRLAGEGVEFKTTETDHSFYEPYSSLRNFTVDGDAVSIRTRNNKKYNFRLLNAADAALVRRLATHHQLAS